MAPNILNYFLNKVIGKHVEKYVGIIRNIKC